MGYWKDSSLRVRCWCPIRSVFVTATQPVGPCQMRPQFFRASDCTTGSDLVAIVSTQERAGRAPRPVVCVKLCKLGEHRPG